jgi:hypothetical protein
MVPEYDTILVLVFDLNCTFWPLGVRARLAARFLADGFRHPSVTVASIASTGIAHGFCVAKKFAMWLLVLIIRGRGEVERGGGKRL